jgi:hypothetical protein
VFEVRPLGLRLCRVQALLGQVVDALGFSVDGVAERRVISASPGLVAAGGQTRRHLVRRPVGRRIGVLDAIEPHVTAAEHPNQNRRVEVFGDPLEERQEGRSGAGLGGGESRADGDGHAAFRHLVGNEGEIRAVAGDGNLDVVERGIAIQEVPNRGLHLVGRAHGPARLNVDGGRSLGNGRTGGIGEAVGGGLRRGSRGVGRANPVERAAVRADGVQKRMCHRRKVDAVAHRDDGLRHPRHRRGPHALGGPPKHHRVVVQGLVVEQVQIRIVARRNEAERHRCVVRRRPTAHRGAGGPRKAQRLDRLRHCGGHLVSAGEIAEQGVCVVIAQKPVHQKQPTVDRALRAP